MTKKVGNTKQHDTSKHNSTTKYQVTANNKIDNGGEMLEDMHTTNTRYPFMEMEIQNWRCLMAI